MVEDGWGEPLAHLQLNATECDNKIIRRRHLETISISHKKSRRRREKIPVIFGLCSSALPSAKLAFWQWNANVAGKVELPSSVSQFLSLSSPLAPRCSLPLAAAVVVVVVVIDLNFMCTQQQQQQQKKWISTALFVRPDSLRRSSCTSFFCYTFGKCPLRLPSPPTQVVALGQLRDVAAVKPR